MTDHAAGWHNDPYGRFQQRYWDGAAWTEHVVTNGVQQVDPLGSSTVIPFVTPATAYTTPTTQQFAAVADPGDPNAQAGAPLPLGVRAGGFLGSLGDDARLRPLPSMRTAVAGIGGAVIAAGIVTAIAGDDPSRSKLIALGLAIIAAAWALRTFVQLPEVQAAAVGMVVVGIPLFAISATVSEGEGSVLTALLMAVLFIAAWALPGFKSRNLLLGLGALSLVFALGALTDDRSRGFIPSGFTSSVGTAGAVYLFGAAVLLALTWWLDGRAYHGTATALASAGLAAALVGTVLLANEFGSGTGPVLVLVVGFLICLVGTHGNRRATTWLGALLAAIGLVAFVVVQLEPSTAAAGGTSLVLSGALLVAITFAVEPIRRAMAKNKEPQAPATPSGFAPPAP
ncbi:MAG TPA: DUF2510 domain-containing protein [Ilumatobacteraceae bacterium]|nr:DUF2510 domain-containing protein [Ilumatobacteraceae bacterium]HRB02025.1 DUF2510 domain-containing protein [Ilumatobacteraceae bacterium]